MHSGDGTLSIIGTSSVAPMALQPLALSGEEVMATAETSPSIIKLSGSVSSCFANPSASQKGTTGWVLATPSLWAQSPCPGPLRGSLPGRHVGCPGCSEGLLDQLSGAQVGQVGQGPTSQPHQPQENTSFLEAQPGRGGGSGRVRGNQAGSAKPLPTRPAAQGLTTRGWLAGC